MTPITLTLTSDQHRTLRQYLYTGDARESVAFLLCGRRAGDRRHRLVVREVHEAPFDQYKERTPLSVTWETDAICDLLERCAAERLSFVKVHSHPGGYAAFSDTDDTGDRELLPMVSGWVEAEIPHGSAVMLPDGQMFGRAYLHGSGFVPLHHINVVGDDLLFWYADAGSVEIPRFAASHALAFDAGTIERFRRISVGVVGGSGTGSPTIEQIARLGAAEIVILDDDHIEEKNVNRIINSTMDDATKKRPKVDVLADAVSRMGLGTRVVAIKANLWSREAIHEIAQCDIVFGCMDTVDGRYLLNAIATYYNMAYFDIGVRLWAEANTNEQPHIREVCGSVHYLQPGRSSLMSRGLFSMEEVAAAGLRRNDPEAHRRQVDDGYIRGAAANRPAVISINMLASSLAVHELLARIHPYREEPNRAYAHVEFTLASMEIFSDSEDAPCPILSPHVGKGDITPLVGMMELAERKTS